MTTATTLRRTRLSFAAALAVTGSLAFTVSPASADELDGFERITGSSLQERSENAAKLLFAGRRNLRDVIVVNGDKYPDALAASTLSGTLGAPVLVVDGQLDANENVMPMSAFMRSSTVKNVHVIGGLSVIGPDRRAALRAAGYNVIETYAGADRYETAALVAAASTRVRSPGEVNGLPTAILAFGAGPADAVAASALASGASLPLLLTQTDELPAITEATLPRLGIQQILVVGGTQVISNAVTDRLSALGYAVVRLAGENRYGTAAAIHQFTAAARPDLVAAKEVVVYDGASSLDALVAGPWAGRRKAALLPVTKDSVPAEIAAVLDPMKAREPEVTVFGDEQTVSRAGAAAVRSLVQRDGVRAIPAVAAGATVFTVRFAEPVSSFTLDHVAVRGRRAPGITSVSLDPSGLTAVIRLNRALTTAHSVVVLGSLDDPTRSVVTSRSNPALRVKSIRVQASTPPTRATQLSIVPTEDRAKVQLTVNNRVLALAGATVKVTTVDGREITAVGNNCGFIDSRCAVNLSGPLAAGDVVEASAPAAVDLWNRAFGAATIQVG
jgi:putative cell wall-binding protein